MRVKITPSQLYMLCRSQIGVIPAFRIDRIERRRSNITGLSRGFFPYSAVGSRTGHKAQSCGGRIRYSR